MVYSWVRPIASLLGPRILGAPRPVVRPSGLKVTKSWAVLRKPYGEPHMIYSAGFLGQNHLCGLGSDLLSYTCQRIREKIRFIPYGVIITYWILKRGSVTRFFLFFYFSGIELNWVLDEQSKEFLQIHSYLRRYWVLIILCGVQRGVKSCRAKFKIKNFLYS